MQTDPVQHLTYHRWATNLLLEAAAALDPSILHRDFGVSHASIFRTLGHIFHADQVWLSRVLHTASFTPVKVEPEQGIGTLRSEWARCHAGWIEWAERVTPEEWEHPVSYVSSGKPSSTEANKIVLHLVNHGSLHRGQVMAMLRQAGVKPPATDLIQYYRSL
ncbi:MAG TPA: DinB family protein [Bryobacteraceae bacterium]|jgi:uncharacterized damage-inducible protein DinB|nr:DinB family protein [Bryobacteraceae bacterium]